MTIQKSTATYQGVTVECAKITADKACTWRFSKTLNFDGNYAWQFIIKADADTQVDVTVGNQTETFDVSTSFELLSHSFKNVEASNYPYVEINFPIGVFYVYHTQLEYGDEPTEYNPSGGGIEQDMYDLKKGVRTIIEQLDDKISLVVDGSSTSSQLVLTQDALDAVANDINLNGRVTFSGLDTEARGNYFGTCSTLSTMRDKVVVCSDFPGLYTGVTISIQFTNKNAHAIPHLNVNNTGAKVIEAYGSPLPATGGYNWDDGATVDFVYDGSFWQMVNPKANAIANNIYHEGTTQIDGGKIYTGSVTAQQIDVNDVFAQQITATGTITGGTFITEYEYDANTSYKSVIDSGFIEISSSNYLKGLFYGTGSDSGSVNSIGQLQLFSGNVDMDGNRGAGSRYTYLNPTNLVVGLGLTDNISSESSILTRVIRCQDGQYLRSKLDVSNESAKVNSEGSLNLFSGNVDSVGNRDVGSRWTKLSPTTLWLGLDANGNTSTDAKIYTHDVDTSNVWTSDIAVKYNGKFYIQSTSGGSYYGGSGNNCILTSNTNGTSFKSLYDLAVTEGNGTFSNTTISSGSWTKIGKFTIPKGKYLIITQADISTASGGTYTNGVVGLGINTGTSTKSSYTRFDSKVNCNAGSVYLQNVRVVSSSSSTDINVWVNSTMANAISVDAGFMYLGLPG